MKSRGQTILAMAVSLIVMLGAVSDAWARSERRAGDPAKAEFIAPTQEDGASYFAENRRDVAPELLAKADKLRRKTIASIQDLLKGKKNTIRRFELLLRLGELYVERHDYLRDLETEQYTKSWDTWSKDKKGKEPKPDFSGSESEMVKAANSFRKLVTEFPKHPHTDAALYSLARTLARLGKDTAIDYYKQLIREFPRSQLLPDAFLSLGEYYFDKHDILTAMANYKKVMDYKDHRAYPYAVYKLGWAYYNAPADNESGTQANYKKAVAAFKLVVKLADKDKARGKRQLDLRDEAIRDLIMVWAEAEDVASAWKYFRTIGEEEAFYTMLERLGNIYADQGKNGQAVTVFQRLLKEAPKRDGSPAVHAKLLELYDLMEQPLQVVNEIKRMHGLYLAKDAQAPWVVANATNPDAMAEAERLVELSTHRFGALYHQRGQKAKNETYLKLAADVYRVYLTNFSANANAYEIRYYLAEILYDFHQWEEASDHYLVVAKADPAGKYAKEAALSAVGAMNQVVAAEKWPALPPPGQVGKPLEVPRLKRKLVTVIDAYVTLLPTEKDGEPMRFTAAQTYFDYGQYPEAVQRFVRITKEIPETKQARAAVRIVLGFYADKEDWTNLIHWGQAFVHQEKLLDAELKKWVLDLLRGAMFKRALSYERAKKYDRAAHSFLEFTKEFPQDENADRSVYNAMLNFFRVGRIESAVATGEKLLTEYPKSTLVPDTLASVGQTHESLARFDEAAVLYQRLADTFPKDQRAPGALYNAAILLRGLKKIEQSTALLFAFTQRYPEHEIGPDAAVSLAQLLEQQGKWREAIDAYAQVARRYVSDRDRNLHAAAKAAALRAEHVDYNAGTADLEVIRKRLVAKDAPGAFEARSTVATSLFKRIDPVFAAFMQMRVTDGSKLEEQVTAKQSKLETLANAYTQIVEIGSGEHVVAALFRLGEAHENFASALFRAPAPKGSTQADYDKLKTELEKVAFPLKEEAYKFFETAFKRSREVETFTAWTQRTYQKMVELAPEKHPAVNDLTAQAAYLSHEVKVSASVADLAPVED